MALLPMGVARPRTLLSAPVVSYTTISPLLPEERYVSVARSGRSLRPGRYPASCSEECGLSSPCNQGATTWLTWGIHIITITRFLEGERSLVDFQDIPSVSKNDQWGGQNSVLPLKCPFERLTGFNDKIIPGNTRKTIELNGGITLGLKSSQKRERQNIKRRTQNRSYKSRARTLVKKAFLAIEEQNLESARETTQAAVEALDKAAAKGAIHKNNAARRKSRLMTRLASLDKSA